MLSKLLRTMLPAVEPWVVPGENVENPGGIMNANPLDTLSSEYHEWGNRVRFLALLPFPHPSAGLPQRSRSRRGCGQGNCWEA